jgi:hypothetical protein
LTEFPGDEDFTLDFHIDDGQWHHIAISIDPEIVLAKPIEDLKQMQSTYLDGALMSKHWGFVLTDEYEVKNRTIILQELDVNHKHYSLQFIRGEEYWLRKRNASSTTKPS